MLYCDTREFQALKEALAEACFRCRDSSGLLVQPATNNGLDNAVGIALAVLMGTAVVQEGTREVGFGSYRVEGKV